jgi:hypothetical protein
MFIAAVLTSLGNLTLACILVHISMCIIMVSIGQMDSFGIVLGGTLMLTALLSFLFTLRRLFSACY